MSRYRSLKPVLVDGEAKVAKAEGAEGEAEERVLPAGEAVEQAPAPAPAPA